MTEDVFTTRSIEPARGRWLMDLITGVRRPFELRIGTQGIEVRGPGGISATWAEVDDVHVLAEARNRYLAYPLTAAAARARGRDRGSWRSPARLFAPQPAVLLSILDADEVDVLDAVRRFSNGRFPTPERLLGGGERRSTPLT